MDFEELICSVCSEYFDNDDHLPRMIPKCGHTFCTKCIQEIIESTSTASQDLFCCPEDNITMQLNNQDVTDFPKNFLLVRLVDKRKTLLSHSQYSLSASKSMTRDEQSTLDDQYRSNFVLNAKAGSQDNQSSKNNLSVSDLQNSNICPEHGRVLEIVCLEDRCRICSNCALFGDHKSHNIKPEGEVLREIATRAEHLIDYFQDIQKQEKTIFTEKSSEKQEQRLQERYNELASSIQSKFNEYTTLLKEQETKLLNNLSKKFATIRDKLMESHQIPSLLQEQISQWKQSAEEHLTIMSEKSEKGEIAFELLMNRENPKDDVLFVADKLEKELREYQLNPPKDASSEALKINVTFNDSFCRILDLLCQITEPKEDLANNYSTNVNHPPRNSTSNNGRITPQQQQKSTITPSKSASKMSLSDSKQSKSVSKLMMVQQAAQCKRVKSPEQRLRTPKNKENYETLRSPRTNYSPITDKKYEEEDTDLLNFELKDLNLVELTEPDAFTKLASTTNSQNVELSMFSSFNPKEKSRESTTTSMANTQYGNVLDALKNLTNRSSTSKLATTERNLRRSHTGKADEGYFTRQREDSRGAQRSISPMRNDLSFDQGSRSRILRKKKSIHVTDKFEPIIQGIQYNTIENADLTGAELGDSGIYKLSEYLRNNTRLKSLKLLKNKITDDGITSLINALYCNKTLQTLNLSQNYLTEKSVDAFAQLFRLQNSVKMIYFNQNPMSLRLLKTKVKEIGSLGVTVNI